MFILQTTFIGCSGGFCLLPLFGRPEGVAKDMGEFSPGCFSVTVLGAVVAGFNNQDAVPGDFVSGNLMQPFFDGVC